MAPTVVGLLTVIAFAVWPLSPRPTVAGEPWRGSRGSRLPPTAVRLLEAIPLLRARRPRRTTSAPTPGELADALVLTALAVRSGLGLPDALSHVCQCSGGAVRDDLAAVVAALRWGRPAVQAWAFAGPGWRPAALAWQVADQTGAPPADLVEGAAHRLRQAEDRDAERRGNRAGVLLVLPLGLGFLPAFACTAVIPVLLALADGLLHG